MGHIFVLSANAMPCRNLRQEVSGGGLSQFRDRGSASGEHAVLAKLLHYPRLPWLAFAATYFSRPHISSSAKG